MLKPVPSARQPSGTPIGSETIETRISWLMASAVLIVLTFSYGAPLVIAVGLKAIAADLGSSRSVPALAASLVWLGSGLGALGFGPVAERLGFRLTVALGAIAIGIGLTVSALGGSSQLVIGHALLVGIVGSGAINIPLMVYISHWFDIRRGSALALVSSGQYIAGAVWPSLITVGLESVGWRMTMIAFGVATSAAIIPLALALKPAPATAVARADSERNTVDASISGAPGQTVFGLLCIAGFLCCVPMAMPSAHLVALCGDLGVQSSRGALMLSVLLGSAFLSRQLWGWIADRFGGLTTILIGSTCQALAVLGFVWIRQEAGLFAVAIAFGLGFSGIIPAYIVALRELFPAHEASWRVPLWFLCSLCGMAFGGWLAGFVYDLQASYAPGFLLGVAFNLANVVLIGWLVAHQVRRPPLPRSSEVTVPSF